MESLGAWTPVCVHSHQPLKCEELDYQIVTFPPNLRWFPFSEGFFKVFLGVGEKMGVGVMWIKCLVQYLAHRRHLIKGINSCLFGSVELDVLIVYSLPKFGMLALPSDSSSHPNL